MEEYVMPEKNSKKGLVGKIVLAAVLVAALWLLGMSMVVTHENEYTLIKQFGKIDYVISEPGLSFKIPFLQTADTVPKEILV